MLNDKFALYEYAVQSPDVHVNHFSRMYQEIRGGAAHRLREDFCGTAKVCVEWIKRDPQNRALGLDLDSETLEYGEKKHLKKLSLALRERVTLMEQDVRKPTQEKSDIIAGCNFSFCIFKDRPTLLSYFRAAHKSLDAHGIFVLELAGGPGMMETTQETRGIFVGGKKKYTYVWDQKNYDPITNEGLYSIHFKIPGRKTMKDAFVYDWRMWTIPEVCDAMKEVGFKETRVYWETEHKGVGTGEYVHMEKGDNSYSWIAYIVGVR